MVAQLHDISDIFLETSKLLHYRKNNISMYTFFSFSFVFFITRIIIYPK